MIDMVFCSYCGENNPDGALKCRKCGRPLSLIPNEPPEFTLKDKNAKIPDGNGVNIRQGAIKSRYTSNDINSNRGPVNRPQNPNTINRSSNTNDMNLRYTNNTYNNPNFDNNRVNKPNTQNNQFVNPNVNNNRVNNPNLDNNRYSNPNINNRNYGAVNDRVEGYNNENPRVITPNDLNNSNHPIENRYREENLPPGGYGNPYENIGVEKTEKHSTEWDVIIATSFLAIILSAILERILPTVGFFVALLVALIYLLIATRKKSTLFKAIPLAIIMVCTISAFFSL